MKHTLFMFSLIVALCLLLSVGNPGMFKDEFCDLGSMPTDDINTSASVGYAYYCGALSDIGLNESFEISMSDGGSELNVSVPPGGVNGTLSITVPMGINLTMFSINLTGLVIDINEPKPVGAVLVTDVSGSMLFDCDGCSQDTCHEAECEDYGDATDPGCRICDAKKANHKFINTVLNGSQHTDTMLGTISYGYWTGWPTYRAHAQVDHCMSNNTLTLNNSITPYLAYGDTPISAGMEVAMTLLDTYTLPGNKVILLMTDGDARDILTTCTTTGICGGILDYCEARQVLGAAGPEAIAKAGEAGSKNISLYAIGFSTGANEDLLIDMAEAVNASGTDARGYYFYATGENLDALYEQIAREIAFSTPEDVYIDVGNNGTQEWNKSGELGTGEEVNIAPWLMWHIQNGCNCPNCTLFEDPVTNESFCEILIFIGSSTGGNITIENINAYAAYSAGHVTSIVVNGTVSPLLPLKGWGEFCFDVYNGASTDVTFQVLRGDHSVFIQDDCENCSTMSTITTDQTACFGLFDINVSGFNPTHNLTFYVDLHSSNENQKPTINEWSVTFYGTEPKAHAGGPYTCTVGQIVTLNGTKSCENFTGCPCSPPAPSLPSCTDAELASTFNFWWTVSDAANLFEWHSDEVEPQFPCDSPGIYTVELSVQNKTSQLWSVPPNRTNLEVKLSPAVLKVEEIELVEPMIKDVKSDTFVIVANEGGQGAGYNITLTVYNLTDAGGISHIIHRRSYNETILSGATLRNRGFSWVPPVKGDYLINATIYNLSDDSIIHRLTSRKVFVRELELKQAAVTGAEYPVMVLLVVLVVVPLMAFYLRKQKPIL